MSLRTEILLSTETFFMQDKRIFIVRVSTVCHLEKISIWKKLFFLKGDYSKHFGDQKFRDLSYFHLP